jgi:phage shock protein PspC (stress-responsive transcriptional regulator)
MERIIQINIGGRVIPIEEDAYLALKQYISTLERQFTGDDGKEIVEEIEHRVAELFAIRLDSGVPAINRADVQKVTDTLGNASDLNESATAPGSNASSGSAGGNTWQGKPPFSNNRDRLLRDPFDKVAGGVCSGIAHYFDIDPTIVRLVWLVLFLTFGIGFLVYIIAWAVIPAARTREELFNMNNANPVTFHDITKNMADELQDLKKRGEQMSRELKDFFSKK